MGLTARPVFKLFVIFNLFVAATLELHVTHLNDTHLLRRIKAADITSWMKTDVDPCSDFYNYACGKWARIHAGLLKDIPLVGKYELYARAMQQRIDHFLKNLKTDDRIHNKIADFIQSCKSSVENPSQHQEEAIKLIRNEFGEFSYLKLQQKTQATKNFNWWSAVALMHRLYDEVLIIDLSVIPDLKNNSLPSIYLDQPEKDDITLLQIENRFSGLAGIDLQDAHQIAQDVHSLLEALQNAGTDKTKSGLTISDQYSLTNITDFQEKYKDLFDIKVFLQKALDITEVPQQIYVENGGYFDDLLKIVNATRPETLEHFILYFLLKMFYVNLNTYTDGDAVCYDLPNLYFGKYIQHTIYEQFRSKDYERQVFELWEDIKSVFSDDLKSDKYQWISAESRQHAIKKLNNMKFHISSYDDDDFEKYFQGLYLNASNFAQSVHNAKHHFKIHRGVQLQIKTDSMEDVLVSAFTPKYTVNTNQIQIPVSFLQPFHIWHPVYPKAVLYAHIGSPVAHEMIHAFDDIGRHFDADGNVNNWWDEAAEEKFESQRRCFQSQYHKYKFAGQQLADVPAQGENIADNAAVKIAYISYMRWLAKTKAAGQSLDTEVFSNLPLLSREKLFFVSFAQYRCETVGEEIMEKMMKDDAHAPNMLRVIGPLSNFATFSDVFKCKSGSPMNPRDKCIIF